MADLERLAQAVRARRMELGSITQAEAASRAGVSDTTWTNVEAAKPVSTRSLAKIERALGWRLGSHQALMEGGDPVVEEPEAPSSDATDELLTAVRDLTEMVRLLRSDLRGGRR